MQYSEEVEEPAAGPSTKTGEAQSKQTAQDEALEETLSCIICYEIMHDCVRLV